MWYDLGVIEDHYQDPDYDYYNENRLWNDDDDDDRYWVDRVEDYD